MTNQPARIGAWAIGLTLATMEVAGAWTVSAAATDPGTAASRGGVLERLDAALARGEIDYSASARQKLYYLFDRARMDQAWRAADDPPLRCGTLLLAEIASNLERLDVATRELYARFAAPDDEIASPQGVYLTPHFRIEYQSSGPDAPTPADVSPANGVPDFVERTGEACEHSWAVEVDALGYRAPEVPNGQGRYLIEFQDQQSYGYTIVVEGQRTRIVLHPSYAGFPTNDDPDGDAIGALRVTVAHELKHAIQRMYSPWAEGSWLELDATWIEELVYDDVNDYYNFVEARPSPFTAPYASLVSVGAASYEDCNWQHFQTERFGNDLMRTFWERRAVIVEPVMNTYAASLQSHGTTLEEAWAEYVCWNFVSGLRAAEGFGYQEAAACPTTTPTFTFTSLPTSPTTGSVPGMAANTALVENLDGSLAGTPEFTFTGSENPNLTFGVSVLLCDRAGAVTRVPMPLVGGNGTLLLSSSDWADLSWAALVVGNTIDFPLFVPFTFEVRAIAPILISHARVPNIASGPSPTPIRAVVRGGAAALDPASVTLTYRIDGGATTTLAMSRTFVPDEYEAAIPPQSLAGSIVEYRISALSMAGDPAVAPAIAGSWYAFEVTSVVETFETPGDWTVGEIGDGATAGLWERAQPVGTIAAPYRDATPPPGALCFLTGQGTNVDGGRSTLLSPVYAFGGPPHVRVVARYRRWYSNHIGGQFDDTWRVDASNDGGMTWTNVETVTEGENDWKGVEVDLLALFGQPAQVRFRFVAEDGGAPSLVEAAVDDFEIVAVLQNPVAVDSPVTETRIGLVTPNPTHGATRVPLLLKAPATISAAIRDPLGRMVRRIALKQGFSAGATSLQWDGRTSSGELAGTGVYWMEVVVGEQRFERKIVLMR